MEVHLKAELLAWLDRDALDLETLAERNRFIETPGPIDAAVSVGLDAPLAFETLHDLLDVLDTILVRDQHRIIGLDNDVIGDTDQRHQAAARMHEVFMRVFEHDIAARTVVVGIAGRQSFEKIPRPDTSEEHTPELQSLMRTYN